VVPVRVGKTGLAWGRGLLGTTFLTGPIKVEGDEKAPAGVFKLSRVFGYARQAPPTRMPYLPLSENIVAVDDPRSRYYNQLLDQTKISHPDWRSAEKMILADDRYKWGVVVDHNQPPKPGAGSSIFVHVWKNPETATTGCTALAEGKLVEIIRWLDPSEHPLLIQLPVAEYKKLQTQWNLPNLR
jgi:L,D-peptidoglycan transpeptidase YkuD (ErfK/YbiS/YcfS/YnhG family)